MSAEVLADLELEAAFDLRPKMPSLIHNFGIALGLLGNIIDS
jgi:hypothetical protein